MTDAHDNNNSLLAAVVSTYGGEGSDSPVAADELLRCLSTMESGASSALAQVRATIKGDQGAPGEEQIAILAWLDEAFSLWHRQFPLEEPLESVLQSMLPVVAAQALVDPKFMIPGAHPLHRLLDTIHDAAIGWQPDLGRAGEGLERDLAELVDRCLGWFEDPSLSFAEVAADEEIRLKRAATRAERMNQRLIEKEQGRVRINACRYQAAQSINSYLTEPLPATIIDFLKGHWFDSAQLVLLKHGADSEEWRSMQSATERLLDSTRKEGPEGDNRRQYLFQLVSQLPRELKRWLLSLQHDKEAIDDTLGLVEYVHLRLLRDDEIELEQAEPIAAEPPPPAGTTDRPTISEGSWYSLAMEEGLVRGRLVLDVVEEQRLVFANFAGGLAATIGYDAFGQMLASDLARPLDTGATFTRCLERAADPGAAEEPAATQAASGEQPAAALPEDGGATIMPFPEQERSMDPQALPIGTWLGFHDGELPLLARLAVHDQEQDSYIFVNRDGVKLRELSGRELQRLCNDNLVNVLELKAPPRTPEGNNADGDDRGELA